MNRHRLGIHVGDVAARRRNPHQLAAALVEGHVAVARRTGVVAPQPADHRQDDAILIEDRRGSPAAVTGGAAELLRQTPAPDDAAVPVEHVQVAVDVHGVQVPGLGSPVTLPHPTRLNGTVVFAMLNLCSHNFVPSPASQQATTSCFVTPSPDRPFAQARPSNTAGVERPIQLSDQIRLSPSLDQAETRRSGRRRRSAPDPASSPSLARPPPPGPGSTRRRPAGRGIAAGC